MKKTNIQDLPDIQLSKPEVKISIEQVGIEGLDVPFMVESKYGGFHETIATVSIRTNLESNIKGISMSRLLITLKPYLRKPLKHFTIQKILDDIKNKVETSNSFIKFNFKIPILKKSPLTDNEFFSYYQCMFQGQLINKNFRFFQGVTIQYASYCPCSTELSKHSRYEDKIEAFPHAQRSFAKIIIESDDPVVWLEDIIENVESKISTIPYPIIKRLDEKKMAQLAGANPLFVEDAVRIIKKELNKNENILDFWIKCTHEESIHQHNAIAITSKGIDNGFNERYFLLE